MPVIGAGGMAVARDLGCNLRRMPPPIALATYPAPTPDADVELLTAIARLLPQLAPGIEPPTRDQLHEVLVATGTTLIIARDGSPSGRIVGMLTLSRQRLLTGVRATIDDVVVDEGARGQGVGAALMREALRLAKAQGARVVDLTSRPSREAANRLYRTLGFTQRETNVYRYTFDGDG